MQDLAVSNAKCLQQVDENRMMLDVVHNVDIGNDVSYMHLLSYYPCGYTTNNAGEFNRELNEF